MVTYRCPLSEVVDPKNIFDTSKMFFGKFLCRIEFNLPAARLLYDIKDMTYSQLTLFLQNRSSIYKTANGNGYCRRESDISIADSTTLFCINEFIRSNEENVKVIIRGANVRVYLTTTTELELFVDSTADLLKGKFLSVHKPANESAELLLKNNVIFVRNPKFDYKVIVREGKYNIESKHRVAEYLLTVDGVYLTPHFTSLITNNHPYLYGGFFVNDPGVTLFTTLIEPTFVNKIYKLEKLHNK